MALFTKYRPDSFDSMVGNKQVVNSVKSLVSKKEVPHSWLFTGMSGSGKTTIARIIAKELGASSAGIFEINIANLTGIDAVRDIAQKCNYRVPGSKISVYILDECFHKDTEIQMSRGVKRIEEVKVGDKVLTLSGESQVKNVIKNRIPISRVVRVTIDRNTIICSEDHKFFTSDGWVEAKNLTGKLILSSSDIITDTLVAKGYSNDEMRILSKTKTEEYEQILLKELCFKVVKPKENSRKNDAVRVGSVESYKSTSRRKFWSSYFTATEIRKGFVDLYDLEIDGHHSYCAGGVFVHNCHQMTAAAQNAILKVLEDAPAHAYFILATTDPHKLLGTIRTRCEEFKFDPVDVEDLAELVADIADKESIKISDDILIEIAGNAAGSPRLALNMLERCSVVGDDLDSARKLISGLGIDFQVDGEFTISGKIFGIMLNHRNKRSAWKNIATILELEVLKANIDVNSVKQGLTSRMGRYLLKVSSKGIANSVIFLETIQSMYSSASFVAVMYKVVEIYYEGDVNGQENKSESTIK